MTTRVFSIRCAAAISEGKLNPEEASEKLRRRLWRLLTEFNPPCITRESRYDSLEIHSDAFAEVQELLTLAYEAAGRPPVAVDRAFVEKATTSELLDLLELWSEFLGGNETREFERALNALFHDEQFPWLVVDSRAFRIDPDFVEREIIRPSFEELRHERFRGALDELSEAAAFLTAGESKNAIQSAAKSFESVLRSITGGQGTAIQLIRQLRETTLFADLPEEIASVLAESVFSPLPFLRNRLSGHGQGESVIDVDAAYAELSVHLAAVYNLFLARRHSQSLHSAPPHRGNEDEVPF